MSEPRDHRRELVQGALFLLGGGAMIFVAWYWGRDGYLAGTFAAAGIVVGVVGVGAGLVMLARARFRRGP